MTLIVFKPAVLTIAVVTTALLAACSGQPAASPAPSLTPTASSSQAQASPTPTASKGETTVKQYPSPPAMTVDQQKSYQATMHTSKGDIVIDLLVAEAPKTVNNFVFLSREGFYDGVKFHRIIKGFMMQGGDPTGTGRGGPGYRFADEPVTRNYVAGTVAMANAGPNTNGSQFFIVHKEYPLQKNYTIFGMVVDGMDVVDKIADTPVARSGSGEVSQPTQDVLITRIEIRETAKP